MPVRVVCEFGHTMSKYEACMSYLSLLTDRTQPSLWIENLRPFTSYKCDVRRVVGEERGKWSLPIINLTLEGGKSGEVHLFKEGRGEITFSRKGGCHR